MKRDTINAKKPSVLIADDEQVIRNLFEGFLDRHGFEVSTVSDGLDALGKIKKNDYDVLILDLKMPRMGGMELLEEMKGLKKDLITIVITGYATVDTAKEAIKKGCFDYITKPFDIEDVGIIIDRALEIRRLREEKKRLEEQFRTAEKLASLAQLGTNVAHEVNTVLTSTKLFLEMLEPRLAKDKKAGSVNLILEEMERVEKLIARFLAFAKPAAPELVKTDINKLTEKTLRFFKYRFEKQKIDILENLNKDLPQIFCDPAEIEEVLLNIYSNSIDAMPEGGKLAVKSFLEGDKAVIIVSNTGIEIPPEDMEKIFDPFFTTKKNGTGLGMAIVHRIIEEHKGIISIASKKDKGTSVRIELPISGEGR